MAANRDATIQVLLADDNEPYLESLKALIERQAMLQVVGTATDGLAALDLVDRLEPDAAVVDLHMPLLDGVSALARMRRDHPNICLIALTGDAAPELHQAARDSGADEVLLKHELLESLVDRLTSARAAS